MLPTPLLWTLGLTAAILAPTTQGSPLHCSRRCTVSFRNSLLSIMGLSQGASSAQMFAPFHDIVAKTGSNNQAIRKITWSCHVVQRFDECLRRCPYSRTKSMKLASLHHWSVVCEALKKSNREFVDFVECERSHMERVKKECLTLEIPPDLSLKTFCKRMLKCKQCYNQVPFQCSANAVQLWKQVDLAIADSFLHVSRLTSNRIRIPEHCDWAITGAPHGLEEGAETTQAPSALPTSPPSPESVSSEEFEAFAATQRNRTLRTEQIEEETPTEREEAPEEAPREHERGPERPVANASAARTVIRYFENFIQSASASRPSGGRSAFFVALLVILI